MPETQAQSPPLARRREQLFLAAQLAAFALGLALTIPTELERWRIAKLDRAGVVAWFFEFSLDTTLPFLLLVVALRLLRIRLIWLIAAVKTELALNGIESFFNTVYSHVLSCNKWALSLIVSRTNKTVTVDKTSCNC